MFMLAQIFNGPTLVSQAQHRQAPYEKTFCNSKRYAQSHTISGDITMLQQNASGFDTHKDIELAKIFVQAMWPDDYHGYNAGGLSALSAWQQKDLRTHITERSQGFRDYVIPWLDGVHALAGAQVLEVGAGTGAATLPLLEQGAIVTGIDIAAKSLTLNRQRLELHGYQAQLLQHDATKITDLAKQFDLIIFFANYEHLTYDERKAALQGAWQSLAQGGHIAIIECPNRLWYNDVHTTLDNFYNWLPDELAVDYLKQYGPQHYRDLFGQVSPSELTCTLARAGRAASYHDLEVIIGPLDNLNFAEGLMDFRRRQDANLEAWWQSSKEARYRDLIMSLEPNKPGCFFYPWFDIIFSRK